MNRREAQREVHRLEREGWTGVQVHYESWRRGTYGLTAVDPATGYTGGPWWVAAECGMLCTRAQKQALYSTRTARGEAQR